MDLSSRLIALARAIALDMIAGDIELAAALNLKAPLASPAFSGSPTAPTPAAGNSSTQLATTAFVQTALRMAVQTNKEITAARITGW